MFLFRKKPKPPAVSAVVPAAGSASRMDGIDKLLVSLGGVPLVVRTLEALSACGRIGEIVLVCRGEQIADYYALVRDYELDRVSKVVGGGEDRQASVEAGIAACDEAADYYLIHDGARPLAPPELIDRCIDAAIEHGAAAAGVPVKDTIKVVGADGFVQSTPERGRLAAVQTPQVFAAPLYREALARAKREGRRYTDDCQLVERAGGKVFIAAGSHENLKVTTPEDLAAATALLGCREEGFEAWLHSALD